MPTPRASLFIYHCVDVQVPYELLGPIYPLLEQHGAHKVDESYDAAAGVGMVVAVEAGRVVGLMAAVADATSGRVQLELAPP
jgi:putative IMPACT (imprinted ancient) family translation regulator